VRRSFGRYREALAELEDGFFRLMKTVDVK